MKTKSFRRAQWAASLLTALLGVTANAAPPVVKTVPVVASNPLVPHSTYSGKTITLKGTCDRAGSLSWSWDFGDGSAPATGASITDNYAVAASHAYTAAVGTVFTARLTIQDTSSGETGTATYFVEVLPKSLDVEASIAIDEGLWYLHKAQTRSSSGGIEYGHWRTSKYSGYANSGYYGINAANINALEVNGHVESGPASDPYTETVMRGMHTLMTEVATVAIGAQARGNPDSNGNGYGVVVNQSYPEYQGGMFMDALAASGTPHAVTTTGTAPAGANPGILGRTYASILQDMVDGYAWAQYDYSPQGGGWRYNPQDPPDNSACQWAAIGMIAAERSGWVDQTAVPAPLPLTVPQWVKDWNKVWVAYSQNADGSLGYTSAGAVAWGLFATTPSGMVQMAWNGIGRDTAGPPSWDKAETFIRNNFGNTGGAYNAIKEHYYGLYSFTKAMLLTPADPLNPSGGSIVMLQSKTAGVAPINWYAAEVAKGDPTNGVARTLIDGQGAGWWWGHNYSGEQCPFETAWAIQMLHRTLPDVAGNPVAVAVAVPNPGVVGQVITLRGSDSYQQDASKNIVGWDWDTNADGIFDASGPTTSLTFSAVANYPVKLRVTDDSVPPKTAETVLIVDIGTPPLAPTAFAGGPYVLCPGAKPWFLDGSHSVNPDEGQHQAGNYPGDTITQYAWDLDGSQNFNNAFGPTPDVTTFFTNLGPGSYVIQVRVTDNTHAAYPSSGYPDLTDTASARVIVRAGADPDCACVTLTKVLEDGVSVMLSWSALPDASSYHIYRGTVAGGPYAWVVSTPALNVTDTSVGKNATYYYVVRPAALNGDEICQSNEVVATTNCKPITVTSTPSQKISNNSRYYRELTASSECYPGDLPQIYVGDTLDAGFVAGPFKSGDVVRIVTGQITSTVKPGYAGMAAMLTVKGKMLVWAVDPFGNVGPSIISP
jgi:hypothetical protein